jgi:hypothetical protein
MGTHPPAIAGMGAAARGAKTRLASGAAAALNDQASSVTRDLRPVSVRLVALNHGISPGFP